MTASVLSSVKGEASQHENRQHNADGVGDAEAVDIESLDPLPASATLTPDQAWSRMRLEAATAAAQEPGLASFLHATVLNHETFRRALSYRIAQKMSDAEMNPMVWREVIAGAYDDEPEIVDFGLQDLLACYARDPATFEHVQPFLYHKGYQGLQAQRVAKLAVAP